MTRKSWSRCSSLLIGLLVVTALAAPVAAVSVGGENVPAEGQVGSQVTATVTLTELYQNPQLESWQLAGTTELRNATWTVSYFDQTGSKVRQESFDGSNFTSSTIAAANGTSEVEVRIVGTVPAVGSFSYDPAQQFLLARLVQTRSGGSSNEIGVWRSHHFTSDSQSARQRLDEAQSAVQSADSQQARETFASAVDAFDGGNFDNAERLAGTAESQAESAQQQSQTIQLALYGVGGLVVVGAVVGGVLWYRSQQDSYDKLG
jgi:Spy/CpxP family protein refolding chaperone